MSLRTQVRTSLLLTFATLLAGTALPAYSQNGQAGSDPQAPPSHQAPEQQKKKKKKNKRWKTHVRLLGDVQYDDNVFLLSDGQKNLLDNRGAAEEASGRFRDMEDTADTIVTPAFDFEAKGPGAGGREMTFEARIGYNAYLESTERSHVELDLDWTQEVSKRGELAVEFDFVPGYFQKNYLFDAVDSNVNGTIEAAERVYLRGEYDTWNMTARYRHRLAKHVYAWGGAGFLTRSYDAPFGTRNRDMPHVDAGLDLRGDRVDVDIKARLGAADSPRGTEVLLLDEPNFGLDFNNDGDTSDLLVRTEQVVDRTHTDLRVGVEAEFEVTKNTEIQLEYQRRHRDFSSNEVFDVAHLGRTDDRDRVEASFSFRPSSGFQFEVGYFYVRQTTNRPGDPGSAGEVTDYDRNGVKARLAWRF